MEALDRRLLPHERDDDVAVGRGLLLAHDDVVALEDPGVAHRVAADAQDELRLVAADRCRHLDVVLDVLLGEHRLARGDSAHHGQPGPHDATHALHGAAHRPVEELDRARLGRVAPQQPDLLQVGQVGVHRRGRRQPDGLADVPHRGRVSVLGRVLADEVVDLLLALRQLLADVHVAQAPSGARGTNMCSGSLAGAWSGPWWARSSRAGVRCLGEHVFVKVARPTDGSKAASIAILSAPRAGGGIGRRARLRALSGLSRVEVRVLFGASKSPCSSGFSPLRASSADCAQEARMALPPRLGLVCRAAAGGSSPLRRSRKSPVPVGFFVGSAGRGTLVAEPVRHAVRHSRLSGSSGAARRSSSGAR